MAISFQGSFYILLIGDKTVVELNTTLSYMLNKISFYPLLLDKYWLFYPLVMDIIILPLKSFKLIFY